MWVDEKFRSLSPLEPSGQALWFFLLTGPHTGPIPGLFRAGRAALAEELGWTPEAFDKAFREVFGKGMVKADWEARVVWIPNGLKCNPPQSPNVITSWRSEWQVIPECRLKDEAYDVLKSTAYTAGEAFRKAFDKAFVKPSVKAMPNQEQEQEQERPSSSEPKGSSDQQDSRKTKTATKPPSQEACRLAALLKSEILRNKADYRITPQQERNWALTAQRMIDLDKRAPEFIADLIRWVQHDEFWLANVLSMDTLREKFDQLSLKKNGINRHANHKLTKRDEVNQSIKDAFSSGLIERLSAQGIPT
jgi:hypothetical protein